VLPFSIAPPAPTACSAPRRGARWHAALLAAALAVPPGPLAAADGVTDGASLDRIAFFEAKIRPIFVEHCWKCHAADAKGGLRLDGRESALAGGDSGPAIAPGDAPRSLIVRAVRYDDPAYQMPPSGKLPPAAIRALEEWVAQGAAYPAADAVAGAVVRRGGFTVSEADRDHWAYRPVVRPPVPSAAAPPPAATGSPIDAFLDAKLAARGITPNPRATPRDLVRRAWFDLVGLPPPLAEVEAFERDPSDAAWLALVDRLLAMPAYGERQGRHWLDVVRYAQTNGYERDGEKPFAWRYRDWVIAAFNDDMPYDRFVREQLAGDLMEPVGDSGIVASGFWHLGTWDDEPDDARLARYDELDDMLATVGQGFLGSTINCARCHDHKFDPIGQKDYYALLGMIQRVRRYSPRHGTEKRKKKDAADEEEVVEIDADAYVQLPGGGGFAMAARDAAHTPATTVLVRGNPAVPGAAVEPGVPEVFRGRAAADGTAGRSGRLALAEWIASRDNPLTPRVMVNRIWLHHFGKGLVPTPNDFGFAGMPPVHDALLDWLAAEFMDSGWSVKRLHRAIMASEAYRRGARADRPECAAVDEGNTLVWRQERRRLEAETIRDAFLAASGGLVAEAGGRGFFPAVGRDRLAGQSKPGAGWEKPDPLQDRRRSVYAFVKRTLLPPELEAFDYTNTTSSVGERAVTTVSPQALLLTNGAFARERAATLALRAGAAAPVLAAEPGTAGGDAAFVTAAYEAALARRPSAAELSIATGYLARQRSAWSAAADPIVLAPLVPGALVRGYRDRLAPADILAVGTPDPGAAGWLVGGGVWGGGYEGIMNLDTATGPFALWTGGQGTGAQGAGGPPAAASFVDGSVEAELFLRGATELAAVVVRGLPAGERLAERFTGYELVFTPPLKSVELRRATADGVRVLAAASHPLEPDAWVHVRLSIERGRLSATLDHAAAPLLEAVDPEPLDRPGHVGLRTWGASLTARGLTLTPAGAAALRIDSAAPPDLRTADGRARRDLCLVILNTNEFLYVD